MSDEMAVPWWRDERRRWVTALFGARSGSLSRSMLAMLLVGLVSLLVWLLVQAKQGQHVLELSRASSDVRRPAPPARASTPVATLTPYQVRTLGKVIDRLNVPWPLLLDDLEQHANPAVAILRLEPDASTRRVNLLVEARAAEDVFRYVDALKSARSLSDVRVMRYEINTQDVARPARFMLVARMGNERHAASTEGPPVLESNVSGGAR